MSGSTQPPLEKLGRSDQGLVDPLGDVRGRRIVTVDGERIGTVVDLLIDRTARSIRFLEIDAERIDGLGRHSGLIPVQAVDRVDEHHVFVGCTREAIAQAPTYNPHVVLSDLYLQEVYEHFDYQMPKAPRIQPEP